MRHVVIIGAGQAGAACAAKLRALNFDGEITIVGDEPAPPYQRPPLSKGYLLGEIDQERLWLRAPDFWSDHDITLKLGQPVSAVNSRLKHVHVGKEVLAYDELVIATGSVPRCLPLSLGGGLGGVFTIRTFADVDRIREEFIPGRRLVVIGGGYIGLEAAAVGRKLGLQVTVIEVAPRILQRVAAAETADYFRKLHHSKGVEILENTGIKRLLGDGRVSAVELVDGRELAADFVITGIGVAPCDALAEAAGIDVENGIRTNAAGQTSSAHIWAVGDCSSFPRNGNQTRIESVGHAIDHAELVAENIMGAGKEYVPKAWFWSDQYDCKLQIAGLNLNYDRTFSRLAPNGSTSIWYYSGSRLLAVDAINDSKAFMVGKRLIESGRSPDPSLVIDPNVDLKSLLS